MWAPNIVLGAAGAVLTYRIARIGYTIKVSSKGGG